MFSFGFFREIGYRPEGPSLYAAIDSEPQPDEVRIIEYLRTGRLEMARFGVELDVLDPEAGAVQGDVDVVTAPDGSIWAVLESLPGPGAAAEPGGQWIPFDPVLMEPKMTRGVAGTGSVLTDGVWRWPDTLAHYVERYHVRIPKEFVDHMAGQKWTGAQTVRAV